MTQAQMPRVGFYYHSSTREVFYNGFLAGWVVPCSDRNTCQVQAYRFLPEDATYEEQSGSTEDGLICYLRSYIARTSRDSKEQD